MEKSTVYLVIVIILALTVLGVMGEYFSYKYYALLAEQPVSQPLQQQAATAPSTSAATTQQTTGSSEKSITLFNFNNPMAVGSIDESKHAVTVTVPPDTDVTKLVPTIETSDNATISPTSNTPQDFTNPVAYAVTAQDGSTQIYTVTVNVASVLQSTQKLITSFKLSGFSPEVDGYIDNDSHTITAVVPDGTDLTKLTPIITVSDGATISPASGVVQDFTNNVTYTVTDSYGSTQPYTITVVTESNSG